MRLKIMVQFAVQRSLMIYDSPCVKGGGRGPYCLSLSVIDEGPCGQNDKHY